MRITRSGLRKIIAEEHARILAETKKRKGSGEPHRDGDRDDVQGAIDTLMDTGEDPFPFGKPADADKTDDEWAEEQLQGVIDYYGHPDPYGDDEALEKGYEYDGAGGWKKPGLDEGDDDALDEYGNPDDSDPDGGFMGGMASDDEMNYLRGGGSYSDSPYADLDVPDNRYTRGRAKGFGKEPRVRGDDIDSGDEDLNESIDMVSAGIGAVVGVASLYAVGGLASVAKQVLNALSDRQQEAALDAAHRKSQSKMAAAVEALSEDEHLVGLFKQLRSIQRSKRDGMARDFTEKTQEINEYIRSKSEDLDFGGMDTQGMHSAVHKRLKKGDRKKSDDEKLDESRWAKLAGILKG